MSNSSQKGFACPTPREVAAKIENGEPVTAPGVPKNYPDAKRLVTGDCIKPAETPDP